VRRFLYVALPAFLTDGGFYLALFTLSHALEVAGASNARIALCFGIYNLAYMFAAPLLGRLSDRHRGASVLVGGLIFALVYTLLAGVMNFETGSAGVTVSLGGGGELALACYGAMAAMALANALFWPAFQARIADREPTPEALEAAIRSFNIAWTAGKSAGFLAGGLLFVRAPQACLWLVAAAGWTVVACALLDRAPKGIGVATDPVQSDVPKRRKGAFLLAALLANFALWGAVSTLKGLAPTLAHGWALSPQQTGILLAAMLAAQGVGFMALQSGRWTYRPKLLAAALPVACLGLASLVWARGLGLALPAALMIGWAQAVTYAASVYYSLDFDERRGLRTGIHEAVLAGGGCLPILGGVIADQTGDELASLWLMLGIGVALALVVGGLLWRSAPDDRSVEELSAGETSSAGPPYSPPSSEL
jgi:MFS family permease